MLTHKVMKWRNNTWEQVGAVELDGKGRSILVLTGSVTGRLLLHPLPPAQMPKLDADTPPWNGHGPLCGCMPCAEARMLERVKAALELQKRLEPQIDFDDDVPF